MGKILFRPTCSKCHKILVDCEVDLSCIAEFSTDKSWKHLKTWVISPNCCPYCKEPFESIIMPEPGKFPVDDHDITTTV